MGNVLQISDLKVEFHVNEGVIRAVDGGKEPETIGHDNIKSLSMVFGAIESARTGMPVDISV